MNRNSGKDTKAEMKEMNRNAGKDMKAEMKEEELLLKIEEDMRNEWNDEIDCLNSGDINNYLLEFNIGDEVIIPLFIERTTEYLHRRWCCGILSEKNENEIKVKIYDFVCDKDAYFVDFPEENIEIGTDAYFWMKELSTTKEYSIDITDYMFEIYKKEHVVNDTFKKDIFYNGIDEYYHASLKNALCDDDDDV